MSRFKGSSIFLKIAAVASIIAFANAFTYLLHGQRSLAGSITNNKHRGILQDNGAVKGTTSCQSSAVKGLIRMQLSSRKTQSAEAKDTLFKLMQKCQPNGVKASEELRQEIEKTVKKLEAKNPTKQPAYSDKMNGFWRMLYTDFSPPAPSSGKLGPFIGDVYQDLDSTKGIIKNILDLKFPPIIGALIAKQTVADRNTWSIEFDRVGNKIANLIPLPTTRFIPGDQIRLWEITYLDSDLRILRARQPETPRSDSFIFVLKKLPDDQRIHIDV